MFIAEVREAPKERRNGATDNADVSENAPVHRVCAATLYKMELLLLDMRKLGWL